MTRQRLATSFFLIAFSVGPFSEELATAQNRIVQLEIAASDSGELTTQHRWMEMLANVGADRVKSRTAFGSAETKVEEVQLGETVSIIVTGFIKGRYLMLPGERFTISDSQGISAYLQKLRDDGARVALAEKKAFGLTSEQLVEVHEELSVIVPESTRGMNTGKVVRQLVGLLSSHVTYDASASQALLGESTVLDELQGLSVGTALATAVRPLGLVVQPYREQGKPLEIRIVGATEAAENWPIGWPIEKPVHQIEPKLFEKINEIEIRGYSLKEILDRFEKRIGVPFIYDQNTMARGGVDLAATKVTLVTTKTPYMVAVTKLLSQTEPKMKQEVRVDENGKAFLWITIPRL